MKQPTGPLLLSTKLKIPSPRKNYVVRKALFEKLSQCAEMSVVFVRGGAGTGKTTLLSSFLRETKLQNVGWLSLDPTNVNVYSFWLYFTEAVDTFLGTDCAFLDLMQSNPDAAHIERLLVMLVNRLCGDTDYYLVLDDVHLINDTALIRSFEFFLKAMPENFHLFMLSREDPPVYLGALAVSGRLLFIDGHQMQLSPEESMRFLKQTMGLTAADEELERLGRFAEGWIGGLQLAAAAGTGGPAGKLLLAGGGIAADYLTREIYASLTQEERDFLIETGFLSYFDAALCAALEDGFTKAQFEDMVASLTRKNLFIICIDEQNGIYRYHNILSEYLGRQFACLPLKRKTELSARAASACETRGDYAEALRISCAAADYDHVLRLARAMEGRIESWSYLNQVPVERLAADADLACQCFLFNLGNMDITRCRAIYAHIKECYGSTPLFQALRFAEPYFNNHRIKMEYHPLSAEQINSLHFGAVAKAVVLVENSAALLEHTEYEEAERCIQEARRISAGTNVFVNFLANDQLAQIREEMGDLNDSLLLYARAREQFSSPWIGSGIGTNFYFGLAGVYLRRMELAKAAETLERAQNCLTEQRIHVDIADMTLAYHFAELKFLSNEPDAGAAIVESLLSEYPSISVLALDRLIWELDCAGRLSAELADSFLDRLGHTQPYKAQPFMRLLRARILSGRGQTAQALSEAQDVLAFARAHKNKLRLVEAGLLKIMLLTHGDEPDASRREIGNLLRESVYYAYKDRILMPFFLDRAVLLPLLKELAAQTGRDAPNGAEAAFVRDTIHICSPETAPEQPDGLSAREAEVLSELARGITNREIAERLCISQATVKTHVLSIFGKLGVSSRLMAVEAGRKKGLIS